MTSLIKNQILKHLTKFFKDLVPEQLQLSAFKGSCELFNLQLEEKVLMELLSFPAWMSITKATCDQISIKIPWTKIKSVPIQMNLNEVNVEVEVSEEFRDVDSESVDIANLSNTLNVPGKYGFVDRVIDGITVTVNNVTITFRSKLLVATFNLSRVSLESRCPNWKTGELTLTRIKDQNRGQILLFKIAEWQTMRLEAKCLTDPQQAPLRLITNHAQVRLTIKKQLDDCSVTAARIFVIFEDILWVLTFAQFVSAASFVEYIFNLIKRSPVSNKSSLLDDTKVNAGGDRDAQASLLTNSSSQPTSLMSPQSHAPHNTSGMPPLLTGNMTSASLLEQKFLCYDLIETSLHFYIDKIDAHLYDDIELVPNTSSNRDYGGALQMTLDQIQVDCYPYSKAITDRRHWYAWFDPSPNSRRQWQNSHFSEFDLHQQLRSNETDTTATGGSKQPTISHNIPTANNDQLLSLTVLVKVKDYCVNCVATRQSSRSGSLNKFIQTDKDYHMPSDMPSLYLELNYYYYFDVNKRIMIYDGVPDPLAFAHLSPTKLLFDPPTLVFLNSFQMNLSKAMVHLNDLFPEQTSAPKVHCRVEILMPHITLPAKPNPDQSPNLATSALMIKSGKITLSNSIYDKNLLSKLMASIDKLRESPSQPINLGGNFQTNAAKKDNSCVGDWAKVWNNSIVNQTTHSASLDNQLWAIQFEPVWMDFMNYDVDDLSNGQRLEPIVEPFNAYAFIHLNLSSLSSATPPVSTCASRTELGTATNFIAVADQDLNRKQTAAGGADFSRTTKKRDIISILVTVMDSSILANMDKVQFSFLQRLGMHVEKLLQQIREDASTIIQMETVLEDTIEVNLTAYIKDIKARLILERKIETQNSSVQANNPDYSEHQPLTALKLNLDEPKSCAASLSHSETSQSCFSKTPLTPTIVQSSRPEEDNFMAYSPEELATLDDCTEVAELANDASCLLIDLGETTTLISQTSSLDAELIANQSDATTGLHVSSEPVIAAVDSVGSMRISQLSDGGQQLKPNIDQDSTELSQPPKQTIETESVSYLELSMSQLMVRRITETKRRQRF